MVPVVERVTALGSAKHHGDPIEPTEPEVRAPDEELLLAYRDHGDRQAFARLVRRYERELFSYLRRYLGDAELAEDAFQGAFLQVHLKADQFDMSRRFRPWLYAIATNQAIDVQRRNRRHQIGSLDRSTRFQDEARLGSILTSDEGNPLEKAETEEQRRWVRDQLVHLPEHLRSVILLVYYQQMKYREAAEALSIPVGTVKSRMHTAMGMLNQAWNESEVKNN
jgi:RNA polymerase sigma-70 factor (ECF subfamily)